MASLKDLKLRIKSVKSTQKITKAMKMVAAAKLRRAAERAEAARPYAGQMEKMIASLTAGRANNAQGAGLLTGTGKKDTYLVVVATSDRGLCGAFNSAIAKGAAKKISALRSEGKKVKVLCVGSKARDLLRKSCGSLIIGTIEGLSKNKQVQYASAEEITARVLEEFEQGNFDVALLFFSRFKSAISQVVTQQQIIPLEIPETGGEAKAIYEFEPGEEEILERLLPKNLAVQVYHALLENAASEQGARMTAMDNATRNAGEMIKDLTLVYNRTRQAVITKELIEIISGAEAV